MQEHNFVHMYDVTPKLLNIALHEMLGAEHRAVYDFDSYEYFWEFGRDAFDRLMDLTTVYMFDIRYSPKVHSDVLIGLPVRVTDEPTKRCCVRLLRVNPKLTRTFSYNDMLNKEAKTMKQEELKARINSAFGSELLKRYVDTDIAATKVTYGRMYGLAMKRSIKNVIFNDPATIVFWSDGTKTVVKAEGETFDPEKGLAMAIAKKSLGNEGNYYDIFRKWLPKEEREEKKFPMNPPEEKEIIYLGTKKFAEIAGVSVRTIRKQLRAGEFSGAFKDGGKWLIPCSGFAKDVDNFDARR